MKQLQGTGLKRFMDNQGPWFNTLYQWVKTRDSCQPEQAIEPSGIHLNQSSSSSNSIADDFINQNSNNEDVVEQPASLFVPVPTRGKKRKNSAADSVVESFKQISEQTTRTMIDFFEKENEKDRKHEETLFQMLLFPQEYVQNLIY